MIITKNKLVTSYYDGDNKIISSVYAGRVNIELAVEHSENLLVFLVSNEVYGMVFDLRKLYGSFVKMLEYYKGIYPITIKSGLTCIAYVSSDDIITNNLILKFQKMGTSFNVKTAVFDKYEEAKKWVTENN